MLKEVRSERYEVDDNGAKTERFEQLYDHFLLLINQW